MLVTEFEFTLPKGYLDTEGTLHRKGIMRLARAMDEIAPLKDPRVKANPAYVTVIILSRVILRLGALDDVNPMIVENFFAEDLNFLQQFYRHINGLTERGSPSPPSTARDPTPEVRADQVRSEQP
jgi:hypothetical protein